MEDKEVREKMLEAAHEAVGNLMYTVIFDTCNEMISGGFDDAKALECASTVANRYVEGGIKVRKKPAPRAKTTKAPVRPKPIDALTAASRKINNLGQNIVWMKHPDNDEYSYSTTFKLATGYPVRDNATQKVVMVADDDESRPLTVKDAKVAISYGLEVDYEKIEE